MKPTITISARYGLTLDANQSEFFLNTAFCFTLVKEPFPMFWLIINGPSNSVGLEIGTPWDLNEFMGETFEGEEVSIRAVKSLMDRDREYWNQIECTFINGIFHIKPNA